MFAKVVENDASIQINSQMRIDSGLDVEPAAQVERHYEGHVSLIQMNATSKIGINFFIRK